MAQTPLSPTPNVFRGVTYLDVREREDEGEGAGGEEEENNERNVSDT